MSEKMKVQNVKQPYRKDLPIKKGVDGAGLPERGRQTPPCLRRTKRGTDSSSELSIASQKPGQRITTSTRNQLEEKCRLNKLTARGSADRAVNKGCVRSMQQELLNKAALKKREEHKTRSSTRGVHVTGKRTDCSKQSIKSDAPTRSLYCPSDHTSCFGSKGATLFVERDRERGRRECGRNVKVVVEVRLRTSC